MGLATVMSELPRKKTPVPLDYRIEISPLCWGQLGTVPAAVFRDIRGKLQDLALGTRSAGLHEGRNEATPNTLLQFDVGGFVSTCEVDLERRTLVLLSVMPRDGR